MKAKIFSMFLIVFLLSTGFASASPVSAAGSPTYPIVDTGQTKCYNAGTEIPCPATDAAFYGQDAQYTSHAPSYTLSANGMTVYDNVSGLTWERSPETNGDGSLTKTDKLTYTNALAHCAAHSSANYQGYNDWRLPTIKELYSLINFNGTDPSGYSGTDTSALTPFIDTTYFQFAYGQISAGERIIDSQYASSTVYVLNPSDSGYTKLFGVNFADGRIKGYDLNMPDGSTKTFFVQCVRGNTSYGINAFVDNSDQTISDNATNLMWTKSDSGVSLNWQDALAWVQTKNAQNYLGHNDWRLPNAKELQSILDYTRSPATTNSAAINSIFNATSFTNEGGQTDWPWYWTSTTHATYNGMGASGIYIAFGRAGGWQKATPTATCYTLYDVHGAGAQRSDPKTSAGVVVIGNACNGGTAYGLGPQGDVQRGVNYVRLVRSVETVTFSDVPTTHPQYKYIQALYNAGFTSGCSTSPLKFCPDTILDRAQSAVFMLRGQFGSTYTPPPAPWTNFVNESWTGFEWAQPWAEGMYQAGLTKGCQTSPLKFCPANQLPRVEASIFGLKMKYGESYLPPAATGTVFGDFPATDPSYSWGIAWAEQAYKDGLLPSCGTLNGKPMFCPSELVNRGWGAYLIVKAKGIATP